MIPINQKSDQFSLQPYNRSCYLKDIAISANIGKAVLAEGGGNDETDFFKLQHTKGGGNDETDFRKLQHKP